MYEERERERERERAWRHVAIDGVGWVEVGYYQG
jgi:hypothetical protein